MDQPCPVSWPRTSGQPSTSAFLLLDRPTQPLLARCGTAIDAGLRSSLTPGRPFQRYAG